MARFTPDELRTAAANTSSPKMAEMLRQAAADAEALDRMADRLLRIADAYICLHGGTPGECPKVDELKDGNG